MRHGSLFSGIGGFDLAAEWMGWENVFHCEWMEFPRKVLVILTYVKLISQNMQTQLTFLLEDSLASHSPLLGNEKARMMNATCGAKCYEQFKKLNRDSSSLKMSLVSRILMADWYSSRCALTWKMKGTKFSRLLFQLVPKTLRTEETDAGLLLKTPCSADAYTENLTKKEQRFGNSGTLAQEVQTGFVYQRGILPTPNAYDYKSGVKQSPICGRDDGLPTSLDGIAFSKWREQSIKGYGNAIVPQIAYQLFQIINDL